MRWLQLGMLTFGDARRLFAAFHEWTPSRCATLRMVDTVGAQARGFLDAAAAAASDDDGEVPGDQDPQARCPAQPSPARTPKPNLADGGSSSAWRCRAASRSSWIFRLIANRNLLAASSMIPARLEITSPSLMGHVAC